MRLPHAMFLAFLLLAAVCPLRSQEARPVFRTDGNNLLDQCSMLVNIVDSDSSERAKATAGDWGKFSWCAGYLEATRERFLSIRVNLALLASAGLKFTGLTNSERAVRMLDPVCIPDEAPVVQLARVVVKWLHDHPERLHEPEAVLVEDALRDAFPCPN